MTANHVSKINVGTPLIDAEKCNIVDARYGNICTLDVVDQAMCG